MTTLVFGAGFLGERLARSLPGAVLARDVDIADGQAVAAALRAHRPDAVVNAAGKTGRPNVDWCESHPVETLRSNVVGALVLAEACAEAGAYLVHLGSGCIFYGPSPAPGGWREDDFANPSALYSRTKYAADLVLSRLPDVGILRLRMPIDTVPGPRNLITKLAAYAQVIDVENSVTIVSDLVEVVRAVIERRGTGVFHATNPGPVRHAHLLALYRRFVDPSHRSTLIREEELVGRGLVARARSNCVLASTRLEELGVAMRPTEQALPEVFRAYAAALKARAQG
ncbi:MAG TPA: sugar nucleotide-binding protein [Polyangiaceae bacterium]|nr:sugar nucleotide-binding protein [Polyangiaceae bacterium]